MFCHCLNWLINFFLRKKEPFFLLGTGRCTFQFTVVVYYYMATNIRQKYIYIYNTYGDAYILLPVRYCISRTGNNICHSVKIMSIMLFPGTIDSIVLIFLIYVSRTGHSMCHPINIVYIMLFWGLSFSLVCLFRTKSKRACTIGKDFFLFSFLFSF